MGILDIHKEIDSWKLTDSKQSADNWWKAHTGQEAFYAMTDDEKKVRGMILRHFALGDITMQKPRVEFNDLSVNTRAQVDEMSWNTYQPNNGEANDGDPVNAWKSNAIRPVVRNKCVSIAAHATARLLFPKVFAYNNQSDVQDDAARVMEDLIEWSGEQSNYSYNALTRVISALVYPASIGYTEYAEVYRPIKTEKEKGGRWKQEMVLDEQLSGFQDSAVPVDQLYIENFYEPDIQKQGWLIWRRVRDYSLLESIYKSKYPNFQFVTPGVQLIYNDANQLFYSVYDPNMRPTMAEEIIYWNRSQDLKIIMVNGVMLTDFDNPNPRLDKLYPFDKFGYELINTRCFYYKSLAFKLQQDANIVNSLYPMIIDGTYLNIFPAMVNLGGDAITNEVIIPGAVTTLSSPDSDLRAIQSTNTAGLQAGTNTLFKVDESLNESSSEPIMQGQQGKSGTTAYEISRVEQNANTVLGLFIKMISDHVKQYGRLRIGDIIQFLTIADVSEIVGNSKLVYKTFLLPNKKMGGKTKHHQIKFDSGLPTEPISKRKSLELSIETAEMEGGLDSKTRLYRVNPEQFRLLKFKIAISPDVLNPRSEDLERAFKLELYDRAISNPMANQEEVFKDFLLGAYRDIDDPDKYLAKPQPLMPGLPNEQGAPNQSPLQALSQQPLPQSTGMTV